MRILLDTHALLWWLAADASLSRRARTAIAELGNAVLVSVASAWEIAIKVRRGKLPGAAGLVSDFEGFMLREGFSLVDITVEHALRAGSLPGPLKDPFDRMLIAQAQAENVPLLSNESIFDSYGIRRLW